MFYKKWFDENKSVLVAGDSHTYGAGHQNQHLDPFQEPPASTSWPNHIWNQNDYNNIAHPGSSNDDITQSVYDHFNQSIKILAVMFTHPNRRKFYFENYGYTFTGENKFTDFSKKLRSPSYVYRICNNALEDSIRKEVYLKNKNIFRQIKESMSSQQSTISDHVNLLQNIIAIQNLCLSKNVKFFWCTLESLPSKTKLDKNPYAFWQIGQLEKLIDFSKHFHINNDGMSEFAKKHGNIGPHFDFEVHELWGNQFKHFINTKI